MREQPKKLVSISQAKRTAQAMAMDTTQDILVLWDPHKGCYVLCREYENDSRFQVVHRESGKAWYDDIF